MKIVSGVLVLVVSCTSPATEREVTQSLGEPAATYRFSGSLPAEGDLCKHSPHYRNGMCGTSFHGYFTIPSTPNPNYEGGYYETPFDEQGLGMAPYGMVLEVDGRRPRVFYYVSVSIANDVINWQMPEGPLVDTLHIGASANYSNDGFDVSFTDPTGTAIDSVALMPDPARFSEVCSDSSGGCPLVVRDAASDFLAMNLQLSRSPTVITVPGQDTNAPYFFISSADWSDSGHTSAAITVDIFDDYTFAGSTCDLWLQVREADGAPEHAVQGIVQHNARGQRHATLSIDTGTTNPERQIRDINLTCSFALPKTPVIESTTIWYTYPY